MKKLVIITGLSGAGKSTVLKAFEDLGYYAIDNFPLTLLDQLLKVSHLLDEDIAIGCDVRDRVSLEKLPQKLAKVRSKRELEIIFLEADRNVIVGRFKETRREHPLKIEDLELAISKEVELLSEVRIIADRIIDTSQFSAHKLRDLIFSLYGDKDRKKILLVSFSYRKGIPTFADVVFDARCLPNPYYIPCLRDLTGFDGKVVEFFESKKETAVLIEKVLDYIEVLSDSYFSDGRKVFVVAIGCTGGKHRSAYVVNRISKILTDKGYSVSKLHREIS